MSQLRSMHKTQLQQKGLGADHLIPGGGGYGFLVKKKIVQQILENK